tara:strand:- start:1262 stop:2044 length:783 start_codon:yes stop_codon:yes gene_type:complete
MELKMFAKNLHDGLKVSSKVLHVEYDDPLYHALNILEVNREILPSKITKLVKSIADNNVLHLRPILIDTNYNIIDGQTRYKAAKVLRYPIEVQIINKDNWTYEDLITINTTQVNWQPKDYLKHYRSQGNLDYEVFNSLLSTNKITIQVLVAIYNEVYLRKHKHMNNFKQGKIPKGGLNNGHVRDALYKLNKIQHAPTMPLLTERTKKNQEFQLALLKNFQTSSFNLESFLYNLKKYPHNFNKLGGKVAFEAEIEEIVYRH